MQRSTKHFIDGYPSERCPDPMPAIPEAQSVKSQRTRARDRQCKQSNSFRKRLRTADDDLAIEKQRNTGLHPRAQDFPHKQSLHGKQLRTANDDDLTNEKQRALHDEKNTAIDVNHTAAEPISAGSQQTEDDSGYYVLYCCTNCDEKFESEEKLQQHMNKSCKPVFDTSWIKDEPKDVETSSDTSLPQSTEQPVASSSSATISKTGECAPATEVPIPSSRIKEEPEDFPDSEFPVTFPQPAGAQADGLQRDSFSPMYASNLISSLAAHQHTVDSLQTLPKPGPAKFPRRNKIKSPLVSELLRQRYQKSCEHLDSPVQTVDSSSKDLLTTDFCSLLPKQETPDTLKIESNFYPVEEGDDTLVRKKLTPGRGRKRRRSTQVIVPSVPASGSQKKIKIPPVPSTRSQTEIDIPLTRHRGRKRRSTQVIVPSVPATGSQQKIKIPSVPATGSQEQIVCFPKFVQSSQQNLDKTTHDLLQAPHSFIQNAQTVIPPGLFPQNSVPIQIAPHSLQISLSLNCQSGPQVVPLANPSSLSGSVPFSIFTSNTNSSNLSGCIATPIFSPIATGSVPTSAEQFSDLKLNTQSSAVTGQHDEAPKLVPMNKCIRVEDMVTSFSPPVNVFSQIASGSTPVLSTANQPTPVNVFSQIASGSTPVLSTANQPTPVNVFSQIASGSAPVLSTANQSTQLSVSNHPNSNSLMLFPPTLNPESFGSGQTANQNTVAPASGKRPGQLRNTPDVASQQQSLLQPTLPPNLVFLPPILPQGHILNGIQIPANVLNSALQTPQTLSTGQQSLANQGKSPQTISPGQQSLTNDAKLNASGQQSLESQEKNNSCPAHKRAGNTSLHCKALEQLTKSLQPASHSSAYRNISQTAADRKISQTTANRKISQTADASSLNLQNSKSFGDVIANVETDPKALAVAKMLLFGAHTNTKSQGPVVLGDGRVFVPVAYTGPYKLRAVKKVSDPSLSDIMPRKEPKGDKLKQSKEKVVQNVDKVIANAEETLEDSVGSAPSIILPGEIVWIFLDKDGPRILWKVESALELVLILPLDPDLPKEAMRQVKETLKLAGVDRSSYFDKLKIVKKLNWLSEKQKEIRQSLSLHVKTKIARKTRSLALKTVSNPCNQAECEAADEHQPGTSQTPTIKVEIDEAEDRKTPMFQNWTFFHSPEPNVQFAQSTTSQNKQLTVLADKSVVKHALDAYVKVNKTQLTNEQLLSGCVTLTPAQVNAFKKQSEYKQEKDGNEELSARRPRRRTRGKPVLNSSVWQDCSDDSEATVSGEEYQQLSSDSDTYSDSDFSETEKPQRKRKTLHTKRGFGPKKRRKRSTLSAGTGRKRLGRKFNATQWSDHGEKHDIRVIVPRSLGKHSGFDVYVDVEGSAQEDPAGEINDYLNEAESGNPLSEEEFLLRHKKDFDQMVMKEPGENAKDKTSARNILYLCTICGSFQDRCISNLISHLKQHYKGELNCKTCKFKAASRQELIEHEALEHTGKPLYQCDICQVPFFSQAIYLNHLKRHGKAVACKICSCKFLNEAGLKEHLERDHPQEYVCQMCNLCFVSEDKVRAHYTYCENGYQCCLCYMKVLTFEKLRTHLEREHQHTGPIYICMLANCRYSFFDEEKLKQHMAEHLSQEADQDSDHSTSH